MSCLRRPGASAVQVKSVATASAAALLLSLLPRHALAQLEAPTAEEQAEPPADTSIATPAPESEAPAEPNADAAAPAEAPVQAAQELVPAGEDGIAEVVVTGIRGSLGRAMDIKRDNKQLVDAIVAVDIGKFPDNNTVEALQRVPGIQVGGRDSGEANDVTIRGLDDISTTLNGRQVFTAADRSIALADIPASLLGGVNVYKTRSPDMIEGGVAGQIDVRTQRPFDFDGSKLVLSARGIHSEEGDTTDPTFSALLSNRWNTGIGEIGALVNVSYQRLRFRDQTTWAGSLDPYDAATGARIPEFNGDGTRIINRGTPLSTAEGSTINVDGVETPYVLMRDAMGGFDKYGERERPAGNIALQWAPNEKSKYLFEAFYFGLRGKDANSQLFAFTNGDRVPGHNEDFETYEGTNVVRRNYLDAPNIYTNVNATKPETDNFMYALGGEWQLIDDFTLKSEVIYQNTQYTQLSQGMNLDSTRYQANVDFNADGKGTPSIVFLDAQGAPENLTDENQWRYTWYYDSILKNKGDAWTWTADGDWRVDYGVLEKIRFGLRFDRHDAKSRSGNQQANCEDVAVCDTSLASNPQRYETTPGNFFSGEANYPSQWLTGDYRYLLANVDASRAMYGFAGAPAYDPANYFDIRENTYTGYVMGDFDVQTDIGSFDGQAGVRVVRAESDLGYNTLQDQDDWEASELSTSRTDALPSAVIRYKPRPDVIARLAYGKTIGRPGFAQLNPAMVLNPASSTAATFGYASSGNPNLDPVEAQTLDLSLEWYFSKSSSIFGTLFWRDVDGFITNVNRSIQVTDRTPELNGSYVLTTPENAGKGKLNGAELGFQWFPDHLPNLLKGFGVQANYTWIDSESRDPVYGNPDDTTEVTEIKKSRVAGVSDWAYSVTLAYERYGVSSRLSWVDRGKFLKGYNYCCSMPSETYSSGEASMDLQLAYDINPNFTVTFDATNLTNEIYRSYYGDSALFNQDSQLYSRTFALGLRYRL